MSDGDSGSPFLSEREVAIITDVRSPFAEEEDATGDETSPRPRGVVRPTVRTDVGVMSDFWLGCGLTE